MSKASQSNISANDLLAELRRIREELGPPPPEVRLSRHAPVFVEAKPTSEPFTDDMRTMCDDIGPQKVAGGYRIKSQFGDFIVLNPVHLKGESQA